MPGPGLQVEISDSIELCIVELTRVDCTFLCKNVLISSSINVDSDALNTIGLGKCFWYGVVSRFTLYPQIDCKIHLSDVMLAHLALQSLVFPATKFSGVLFNFMSQSLFVLTINVSLFSFPPSDF